MNSESVEKVVLRTKELGNSWKDTLHAFKELGARDRLIGETSRFDFFQHSSELLRELVASTHGRDEEGEGHIEAIELTTDNLRIVFH